MIHRPSPHRRRARSTQDVMRDVLLALVPGTLVMLWLYGPGVLTNLLLTLIAGVATEAAVMRLRGRAVKPPLRDLSALVASALIGLSLPPLAPFWIPLLAGVLAIGLGKQLFGGLGHNPFNPAMVAYAVLLISFPVAMTTTWVSPTRVPDLLATLGHQFGGADGWSGATPLDRYKDLATRLTQSEIAQDPLFNAGLVMPWALLALAWALGGAFLIWRRATFWHAPAGLILGILLPAGVFGYDGDQFVPASMHLLTGATVFAAFFIVTDPVSGATSPRGRLAFGFGAGVLTWVIRTYGGYPDAIAFAVLLMNLAAPMLDQFTRPRVYGHDAARKGPVLEKRS